MKRTKPDYSIAKVWTICPDCGNNYPSRGDAPLCNICGYDDFAEYRREFNEDGMPVFLPGEPTVQH